MANEVRGVLVGCGAAATWCGWGEALNAAPELEIVGLVDLDLKRAERVRKKFGFDAALVGTDFRQVFDEAKPDVVFDATTPEVHHEVTLEALRRGCHVLGEKPLADSMVNARRAVAAAQAAGRIYAVIQNARYEPNIRRVRRFLEAGAIGRLTTVHCDYFIGPHFGGFRDRMQHVLLLDKAIHSFDAARFLTGADARSVFCREWNPGGSWYDHDASAVAFFDMTKDIVFTFRGSWCAEGLNTSSEGIWRFLGERGTLLWNGSDDIQAQIAVETKGIKSTLQDLEIPEWDDETKTGDHTGLVKEFVNCVLEGREPETVCTDNIRSLAMVFAAIESARTGDTVKLSDVAD